MNKYPDQNIVKKCLIDIEQKLDWGKSSTWHNEVFEELSELIHESTHILLSDTTLKRVWGRVNYDGAPSISTLNALSNFLGYANWREYKTALSHTSSKRLKIQRVKIFDKSLFMVSLFSFIVILLTLAVIFGSNIMHKKFVDIDQLKFTSNVVTEGLPNSVVFDFDLQGIDSDSIYIQQFWDPTRTIKNRC